MFSTRKRQLIVGCRTKSPVYNVHSFLLLIIIAPIVIGQDKPIADLEEDEWDYPLLSEIPNTGFDCIGRIPGYYADDHPTSLCQVFHYCHHDGRIFDFLCPNSTIFNQQVFACDHFYNFECDTAKDFYYLNELFLNGTISDESHV